MTGRRSHGRLSALNGVVHQGTGSTPCPASPTASARIPPARASSSTPNTSPSASTCPPRGRTFSTSPTIPAGASRKPRPHLGGDRRSRRRHPALARALEDVGGTHPPHLVPHRRGPGATAGPPRPRQPAGLPPRRHRRPALAHRVAHRLPGRWGADPLPSRLPPHRRPQPHPRERPRAGRHAPDRAQEPRHLRPLQHWFIRDLSG